jgi:hypothetical protein
MKLTFERKDIEALLLEKAKAHGIDADTIEWDSYSSTRCATVSCKEPVKAETTTLQVAA